MSTTATPKAKTSKANKASKNGANILLNEFETYQNALIQGNVDAGLVTKFKEFSATSTNYINSLLQERNLFRERVDAFEKNEKGKKKNEEKDPNAPKKPMTAYFRYAQDNRAAIIAEIEKDLQFEMVPNTDPATVASMPQVKRYCYTSSNGQKKTSPSVPVTLITTMSGKMWGAVAPDVKKQYEDRYKSEIEQWNAAMSAYNAQKGGSVGATTTDAPAVVSAPVSTEAPVVSAPVVADAPVASATASVSTTEATPKAKKPRATKAKGAPAKEEGELPAQ